MADVYCEFDLISFLSCSMLWWYYITSWVCTHLSAM